MKQWLLLMFVFCLFILAWSSVAYQILSQPPPIMYADGTAKVPVNANFKKGIVKEQVVLGDSNEDDLEKEVFKTQTQKNKQISPPLEQGIDFGEGISVDDVLKSFGLAMSD